MKVSVAMTTYCGERFLLQQLMSLQQQKRVPDEVIICDDCSSDGTVDIVRNFIEGNDLRNWKLILNEKNLGYVRNFKKALSLASGDIVFPCDQDDIWNPEKIQRIENVFLRNPQMLAVACDYQAIDAEGMPLQDQTPQLTRRGLQRVDEQKLALVDQGPTLYSNVAQGCACAYRREIVDAYCAAEEAGSFPHDWAMNLLAHEKKGLYFLHEPLLGYRIHGNNTIGISTREQAVTNRVKLLEEYARCMEQAAKLPQSKEALACLNSLEKFTDLRIEWIRKRNIFIWIKGFFRYFGVMHRYFFLQYMKDLVLVFFRKIPGDEITK